MSTITASYSRAHQAFAEVAAEHGLCPFDVRVLVALHDLGGEATSRDLREALGAHSQAVRRSLLRLWPGYMEEATGGAALVFTDAGWQIARDDADRAADEQRIDQCAAAAERGA